MKIPRFLSFLKPPVPKIRPGDPADQALNLSTQSLVALLRLSNRRRYKNSGFGVYLKKIPHHAGTFEVGIRNRIMGHLFVSPNSKPGEISQTPLLRPSEFVEGKSTLLVMFLERLAQHLSRERDLEQADLMAIETLIEEHYKNGQAKHDAEEAEMEDAE